MTYTLIIAEKPDAAARIAEALNDKGRPAKHARNGVPYYIGSRKGKEFVACSSIGHLYTVAAEDAGRFHYPVFSFNWVPKFTVERNSKYQRAWIEIIQDLGKEADDFINACDYDVEGSLIGFSILKYALGDVTRKSKRMKYSTLTKDELAHSYDNPLPTLDFSLIEAGKTRHEVDWLYGINLSRAMMKAAYTASDKYSALSIGRIQGPTLKALAEREREINNFVPIPYWSLKCAVEIDGKTFSVRYDKEKIDTRDEAQRIVNACNGKEGLVDLVEAKKYYEKPPPPFDVGGLQAEAYRLFGYFPSRTVALAERLYLEALISYPRTGSQKLPPSIGYRNILMGLGGLVEYSDLANEILSGRLIPNEGTKTDPAHPAIYPTGNPSRRRLSTEEHRLYDLIVKRFLAVFSTPSHKERTRARISCGEFIFSMEGFRILEEGWMRSYMPYTSAKEVPMPALTEGQRIIFLDLSAHKKFVQPPSRYNPSSLLKLMEEQNIGTKATRADIIETLMERGYIRDERITMTELGFGVVDTFEEMCQDILSVDLTRKLEKDMELIEEEKKTREEVLIEAVSFLRRTLATIRTDERRIGARLTEAKRRAWLDKVAVSSCPSCRTGKLLMIRSRSTGKVFIGCSNYQSGTCSFSAPLPQHGIIRPSHRLCHTCGYPTVIVRRKKSKPWSLCINIHCPSKEKWGKRQ
ncbi:MAG TPA: DNA topoisomerase I [Candidatus Bathyarchaeia archaeon]|nr:MAG: DNA topoisomerase I [Candidatus Bathyarchaeota archaeon RBG_16_48_13]HJX23184.1 DNA topoisomerase I [Candidatus Bathyarchaeia archaeon]